MFNKKIYSEEFMKNIRDKPEHYRGLYMEYVLSNISNTQERKLVDDESTKYDDKLYVLNMKANGIPHTHKYYPETGQVIELKDDEIVRTKKMKDNEKIKEKNKIDKQHPIGRVIMDIAIIYEQYTQKRIRDDTYKGILEMLEEKLIEEIRKRMNKVIEQIIMQEETDKLNNNNKE